MGENKNAPCGSPAGTGRGERHAKAARAQNVASRWAPVQGAPSSVPSQGVSRTDRRETADDYHGVILCDGRIRVAVYRDGRQWLLQRRRPGNAGVGAAWDTLAYCASLPALMRLHRALTRRDEPALAALPPHIAATRRREGQA